MIPTSRPNGYTTAWIGKITTPPGVRRARRGRKGKMVVPKGTHVLLDKWHANRHEDHWGVQATGYPALDFVPERWAEMAAQGRGSKEILHFGFGHRARVYPGNHLGQLEVGLVVGALVKMFKFKAENRENHAKAGVSTKP